LGFYDLRLSETREQQAALAKEHGIEGFMYWHYWFAGKRLLERPFCEVLQSKKPDFPFCLGWANETWTGIWHGLNDKILVEQTYPGTDDYKAHFYAILPAFQDARYITVDGKPLFLVYNPLQIPDCKVFINTWQELAKENRLEGIYFVGFSLEPEKEYDILTGLGFDGIHSQRIRYAVNSQKKKPFRKIKKYLSKRGFHIKYTAAGVHPYEEIINKLSHKNDTKTNVYPMVIPNWDNSPRSGRNSLIFENSTPELFRKHLRTVFDAVKNKPEEHRIVFIKSWNEWAEGNYLEPDMKHGREYLEVFREELNNAVSNQIENKKTYC
jgi:lipopolysaccharide biosynthesis protein